MLCDAQQSQLLIIDVQEKLVNALPPVCVDEMLRSCELLINAAQLLNIPILHSEQYPQGLGRTQPNIANKIHTQSTAVEKTCFSCASAAGIIGQLNHSDREQVIIVGIEAHICVLQTACELFDLGYDIFIAEDGICSRKDTHRTNAIARLRQAGVIISNSESIVFEWLRDAQHPHFKTIAKLLR